jgi:hypothetical protein
MAIALPVAEKTGLPFTATDHAPPRASVSSPVH